MLLETLFVAAAKYSVPRIYVMKQILEAKSLSSFVIFAIPDNFRIKLYSFK